MVTIAVIDKHPVLRIGLALFLKETFSETSILESESALSFLGTFYRQQPDLIILGINQCAHLNNQDMIRLISRSCPQSKIIVNDSLLSDEFTSIRYLLTGANGYLSKRNKLERLKECVEAVLSGKRYV